MSFKIKSMTTVLLALFVASTLAIAVLPVGLSYGDGTEDTYYITIEVGQTYEYEPIFNIKEVNLTATTEDTEVITVSIVEVDVSTDNGDDGNGDDGNGDDGDKKNIVTIKGKNIGVGTVEITGTSKQILTNTKTQTIQVEVIAALSITTGPLTFFKDMPGSEGIIESTNHIDDVVYSAQGLPAGLHIDASGKGLIYGKATVIGVFEPEITATNLKTGAVVKKQITISVVDSGSDFELTAGSNVFKISEDSRYFVDNSVTSFDLESDVIDGEWIIKASDTFAGKVEYSVDILNKKLIFTPVESGDLLTLSGDYAVQISHTNNGVTTVKLVVIHFQVSLEFDTAPVASFEVGYAGSAMTVVVSEP